MKKHKGILMVLIATLIVFFCVFVAYLQKENVSVENDISTENDAEAIKTEGMEDTESLTETETEEIELSYIEMYGLEHVDKPERLNKEQMLEKMAKLAGEHELVRQIYENMDLYSKEMLWNLVNNPEMAAYVIGSLEADGSVTGGFTEKELEDEFPLLLQFDPRWGYYEYGGKEMGLSGCGPTCLSMAVLALTGFDSVTPDKIAAYSTEKGYYVENVGTAWALLDEFPVLYGLSVENPGLTEVEMKAALDEGKVLICSMREGVFTAGGHFVMFYGYDESGYKVNDPMCVARSRQTWAFEEFGNQIKRIWAIGAE